MLLAKRSSFCLLSFTHYVQCEKTENSAISATAERTHSNNNNKRKDTKITVAQSTIYKIKRLNPSKDKQNLQLHKQRIEEQHQNQQQNQHQQLQLQHQLHQEQKSRQQDVMHHQEYKGNYKVTEKDGDDALTNKHRTKKFRKSGKNSHGLNRKLLK